MLESMVNCSASAKQEKEDLTAQNGIYNRYCIERENNPTLKDVNCVKVLYIPSSTHQCTTRI